MTLTPPSTPRKGRGALDNIPGRFEVQTCEAFDDGWGQDAPEPARLQTQIISERAKTILSHNRSPDIPFQVSLNPYRGCEHGCIYCFARPSHSYLGMSPGLDFESRIIAKVNAPALLRQELARSSYTPEPIALGINTDAYQPCERQLGLTRELLEIFSECRQPIGLITKSALIERDLDILAPMAHQRLLTVAITLTTLDHSLARTLEPRATAPRRRLEIVRRLTAAGITVSVNIAPVIPFITDNEMEEIIAAVAEAGAVSVGYIVLRLPWEVNPIFQQWLQTHFPERAERVMNRVRDLHGGKDYNPAFGERMRGQGMWADLLRQRFTRAVSRSAIANRRSHFGTLDCSLFRRPRTVPIIASDGERNQQADIFG